MSTLNADKVCSPGFSTNCLWDCDLPYYWNGYSCDVCPSKCFNGCQDSTYCNICTDPICYYCHDYTTFCDSCKPHSTLRTTCECNPSFYWDSYSENCLPCDSSCTLCSGPLKSQCEDCVDSNCALCYSTNAHSCVKCESNYELKDGVCIGCSQNQYYDSVYQTCNDCVSPCVTCISLNQCKTCIKNSQVQLYGECVCDAGYIFTSFCERQTFSALYSISNQNVIKIRFDEPLSASLKTGDLTVTVPNSQVVVSLAKVDSVT